MPSLFGLAPGGVCPAASVTGGAVRSCRTVSTLPARRLRPDGLGGLFSVALSLGLPPPGVTRHLYSMEPGLSSRIASDTGGRPTLWRFVPSANRAAGKHIRVDIQTAL